MIRVLDALLVLVAWAQRDDAQPLVTLRVQLWVRELRRMVSKLSVDPLEVNLRSERDLPGMRDGVYLPMVQCSQCRTTGWLSRLVPGSSKLSTQLDEIYNTWFSRRPEAARLYAAASVGRTRVDGVNQFACVACANVQHDGATCEVRIRNCWRCCASPRSARRRLTMRSTRGTTPFALVAANMANCCCAALGTPPRGRKWWMPVGRASSTTTRS